MERMDRIPRGVKKLGQTAVQMLFPLRCPVCDGIVRPWGARICPDCLPKLKPVTPPWCMRCGKKLSEEAEYCADCRAGGHEFVRGRSLYEYDSAAASIYRFKYGGRREYAGFYGEQAAEHLGDFIRGVRPDGLIPIPLHPRREAGRGYNQAALLAKEIGARTGIPVYTKILLRTRNTAPLKKLNPKERQNNLKKAFHISGNDVKLKTIILVDDIFTTGSTVDEAARTLKEAGVEKVYFIALSCGAGI